MFWLEIRSREETLFDDLERHIDYHLSTTLTSVSDFKNIILMLLFDVFVFSHSLLSVSHIMHFSLKLQLQKFPEGRNVTRKV